MIYRTKSICQIFHQRKKVLRKIEEMVDVFLNLANFAPLALLTLAPPVGNALNLKALIKVSKVHLGFHMKHLDLYLKKNLIRQTSYLQKNASQKPTSFRVNIWDKLYNLSWNFHSVYAIEVKQLIHYRLGKNENKIIAP